GVMARKSHNQFDPCVQITFPLDGKPPHVTPDLTQDEVTAVGYVTTQWAFLEHVILVDTIRLAHKLKIQVPNDASNLSFTRRLRAWRTLVQQSRQRKSTKERLLKLASQFANAENKGHQITHGLWQWQVSSPHRLTPYSFRPTVEFSEP